MNFHYDKHFAGYISNLNNLIKNTSFENYTLKKIIIEYFGGEEEFKKIAKNILRENLDIEAI